MWTIFTNLSSTDSPAVSLHAFIKETQTSHTVPLRDNQPPQFYWVVDFSMYILPNMLDFSVFDFSFFINILLSDFFIF